MSKWGNLLRGYCHGPARGDGGLIQHSSSGVVSGCWTYVKVNAEGFPNYWVMGCERMRKVEDDFKELGLSDGTMGLISAEMGRP